MLRSINGCCSTWLEALRRAGLAGLCAFGLTLGLAGAPAHAALPGFQAVQAAHVPSDAWLLDRHGEIIHTLRVDDRVRRLPWVGLGELSPAMIQALLVSEDRRFMQHTGVDVRALAAALWDNLSGASQRGASTLTMQLAGLLKPELHRPAGGRTLAQKWDQMRTARAMERTWSKQQILEAYLNRVQFRGELAGVHAAARGLFDQHPSALGKAEASILAALLRGPNAAPAVVARRACGVAAQLPAPRPSCASIERLARRALAAPARLADDRLAPQLAPHFARQLIARLPRPPQGGERIATSLDADLQRLAQQALDRHLRPRRARSASHGAVLVLDNASGAILAYVGASLAADAEADGKPTSRPAARPRNGPAAPAQAAPAAAEPGAQPGARLPGASLKPFLYGLAIEQGLLGAASPLEDDPPPEGSAAAGLPAWVSLRTALASGRQTPALRVLEQVGEDALQRRLIELGFEPAPAAGGAGALAAPDAAITLLQLANAYRVLANAGRFKPEMWQPGGPTPRGKRVMPAAVAWIIGDILAVPGAADARAWAALHSGASPDMRDHWSVGYTAQHTVAVWLGHPGGLPMSAGAGSNDAAALWQQLIHALPGPRPAPTMPVGVERLEIRFEPPIEPARSEVFLASRAPGRANDAPPPTGDPHAVAAPAQTAARSGVEVIVLTPADAPPHPAPAVVGP